MSYDLNIFRVNRSPKRFALKELEEKLHTVFDIFEHDYAHKEGVEWFTVHYRDKSPNDNWEFHYQKDTGCYWMGCSYGVDQATFTDFRKVVRDVAVLLNASIQDPQISEETIDPKNFNLNDPRSNEVRTLENHLVAEVAMEMHATNAIPSIENYCLKTAETKYFILYFIIARIPNTTNTQYLVLNDGRFFASKVNKGETLTEVLNKEISELTGSNTYYVDNIIDKYDSAPDKENNYLPRTAVVLRIPYFKPDKIKARYPMKWVDAPSK